MKNSKGQIFTTDLIVALTALLFILVISVSSFGLIQNSLNEEEFYSEMQEKTLNASQALVSTPGDPDSWELMNDLNVNSIGIAKERNVLDEKKIDKLIDLNQSSYSEIKEILGLGKYDFYFKVTEMNSASEIKFFGVMPGPETKAVVIERFVLLNGVERKLVLGVFG